MKELADFKIKLSTGQTRQNLDERKILHETIPIIGKRQIL